MEQTKETTAMVAIPSMALGVLLTLAVGVLAKLVYDFLRALARVTDYLS